MKTIDEMNLSEQMELIKKFDSLPESVRLIIWDEYSNYFDAFMSDGLFRFSLAVASSYFFVSECESPIEQILKLHLDARFMMGVDFRHNMDVTATPQVELTLDGNTYRVDFMLRIIDDIAAHMRAETDEDRKSLERHIVVECDGHDYHERTKTQAQRDKSRDRTMLLHGYPVLRFTGSEIYKNPVQCCEEIAQFIIKTKA